VGHATFLLKSSLVVFALTAAWTPAVAHAQQPSSADRATARTLAQEGYEALRDRDYTTALDRFNRANQLVRAPTLLRDLARAQVGLGRLVDAHETYSTILREGVSEEAPQPWIKAVEDAKTELAALSPRLPWVIITVSGPAHPRVTIDGAPVPESALGVKRPADPGRHEIRALAPGYYTAKKTVLLKEGETLNIAFELEDAPPDAAPKSEEEAGKVSVATVKDPAWRKPLTVGAFILGGAGIAVGSTFGIMAMTKHNQLSKDCEDRSCGPEDKDNFDRYHTYGTVSTIGFVAGGVATAAGVVLVLVRPQILVKQEPLPKDGAARSKQFSWSPFIGVGSAGVEGTF
jgi:PEGA domain